MPRQRSKSPPPTYQATEQEPLLYSRSGRTHGVSALEDGRKNGKSSSPNGVIILCIVALLFIGPACGFLGVFIARSTSTDITDPQVRHRILQEFNATIQKLRLDEQALITRRKEMERSYKTKADELQHELERAQQEREQAKLYWVDVRGEPHCIANGRKGYSARLANLPMFMDKVEACRATPMKINGITYQTPVTCEDRGIFDGVYGHWIADNEAVCSAYWEFTKQKDCIAPHSGFRRIEAKLGGVHPGENPERLCLTTPLTIYGQTYERPNACPNWGKYGFWGIWDVRDDNCR
ncbi:hypothetical protein FPV67DRAFT_625232 [Lyophyllum atratum]|nr:hypothetical protein FPV67DRAFT_625232 [Lyophyllum atratum]